MTNYDPDKGYVALLGFGLTFGARLARLAAPMIRLRRVNVDMIYPPMEIQTSDGMITICVKTG